jgi:hypothetical protein
LKRKKNKNKVKSRVGGQGENKVAKKNLDQG